MTDPIQLRSIERHELPALLDLYRHLHAADAPPPDEPDLWRLWDTILDDPHWHYIVAVADDLLVASCTLAVIPNLTRGARPYGLIENVVTHATYRRRGIGTRLLRHALSVAWERDCYKVMLLTGRDEAQAFYEHAGFTKGAKTGFVATQPYENEC